MMLEAGSTAASMFGQSDEEKRKMQHKLMQPLGEDELRRRPGRGGAEFIYLEGWKAFDIANDVFGFSGWGCTLQSLNVDFTDNNRGRWTACASAIVRVTLANGNCHEDVGCGSSDNQRSRAAAIEVAKKAAVTDARKRALRLFGPRLGNQLHAPKKKTRPAPAKADVQQRAGKRRRVDNPSPKKSVSPPAQAQAPAPVSMAPPAPSFHATSAPLSAAPTPAPAQPSAAPTSAAPAGKPTSISAASLAAEMQFMESLESASRPQTPAVPTTAPAGSAVSSRRPDQARGPSPRPAQVPHRQPAPSSGIGMPTSASRPTVVASRPSEKPPAFDASMSGPVSQARQLFPTTPAPTGPRGSMNSAPPTGYSTPHATRSMPRGSPAVAHPGPQGRYPNGQPAPRGYQAQMQRQAQGPRPQQPQRAQPQQNGVRPQQARPQQARPQQQWPQQGSIRPRGMHPAHVARQSGRGYQR